MNETTLLWLIEDAAIALADTQLSDWGRKQILARLEAARAEIAARETVRTANSADVIAALAITY